MIVDRPADDEPDSPPTALGRHLLRIAREYPGQWREAYEHPRRELVVRQEGCLIGRGSGRIGGITDITGWEARVVERDGENGTVYVLRVRYTPKGKQASLPIEEPAGARR